jgi:hypothetical protein
LIAKKRSLCRITEESTFVKKPNLLQRIVDGFLCPYFNTWNTGVRSPDILSQVDKFFRYLLFVIKFVGVLGIFDDRLQPEEDLEACHLGKPEIMEHGNIFRSEDHLLGLLIHAHHGFKIS